MLDTVIFSLSGRPVLLIDLVSSVLGLVCVFLAGRNSKYNFWVGYLYTAALFFLFWSILFKNIINFFSFEDLYIKFFITNFYNICSFF